MYILLLLVSSSFLLNVFLFKSLTYGETLSSKYIMFLLFFMLTTLGTVINFLVSILIYCNIEIYLLGFVKLFYIYSIASLLFFPFVVKKIIANKFSIYICIFLVLVFVCSVFIVFNNFILSGVDIESGKVSVEIGGFHWLYILFVFSLILYNICNLYLLHKGALSSVAKIKVSNLALVIVPFAIAVFSLCLFSLFDFSLLLLSSFSFFQLLLLPVLYVNIQKGYLIDFTAYLPWTKKGRRLMKLTKPFWLIENSPVVVKELSNEYEDGLFEMANDLFDKQKEAAVWLSTSEARFSRYKNKIKRKN